MSLRRAAMFLVLVGVALVPGAPRVAARYPPDELRDGGTPAGHFATARLEDPDDLHLGHQLDCGGFDTEMSFDLHSPGPEKLRGYRSPELLALRYLDGYLQEGDRLERSGHPGIDHSWFLIVREGRAVARVELFEHEGRWYFDAIEACE
jgi:hypothetical protein